MQGRIADKLIFSVVVEFSSWYLFPYFFMPMIFCTIQSERLRGKGKPPINHARINRKKRLNRLDQQIKEEDGRRRARQEGRKPRRFRKTPSKIEEARVRMFNYFLSRPPASKNAHTPKSHNCVTFGCSFPFSMVVFLLAAAILPHDPCAEKIRD